IAARRFGSEPARPARKRRALSRNSKRYLNCFTLVVLLYADDDAAFELDESGRITAAVVQPGFHLLAIHGFVKPVIRTAERQNYGGRIHPDPGFLGQNSFLELRGKRIHTGPQEIALVEVENGTEQLLQLIGGDI